ncbi:MAG: hypothetical protein LBP61_01800 [Desulfovibrio sp.]|jgi:hypothetical protein|nr:hypothetical protein [Desulfovibrio sp.]
MAVKKSDKESQDSKASGSDLLTVSYNSPRGIAFRIGDREILINGNASRLVGKEKGIIPVGRYGYTRIAAEDWDAIEKAYGSMAIFQKGLIFAEKSRERAEDRAEEMAGTRHGLEPVNPETTNTEEAKAEA